jgi:AsmA protein
MKRLIAKSLKIFFGTIGILLLAMFLFPILFPGKIEQEVKDFANRRLKGELNFKEAQLSFFSHFPYLTLSLTEFDLKGSAPYRNETLVSADEIAFGINLKTLFFDGAVSIDKIYLDQALINVKVDKNGNANYNVYVSDDKAPKDSKEKSEDTSLKLERISIENTHLSFNDQSTGINIKAKGFNYLGKGDLDKAIFDLDTEADIDDFSFSFKGENYLKNKKVNAELITKINTNSLSFIFEENNLKINRLPIDFVGKLDFLSNGYDLDFKMESLDSQLADFFTALPPAYVTWLDKTQVEGRTDLVFTLKGKYIASTQTNPDIGFQMKIREGEINHNKAPVAASNIFFNFETRIPELNPEKLEVNIDSLFFNVGSDYAKAIIKTKGLKQPEVNAILRSKMDLAKMNRALGITAFQVRGTLLSDIVAKGTYDAIQNLIPSIKAKLKLTKGYLKTSHYPNPITNIHVETTITDVSGQLKDLQVTIQPASFVFEKNPVYIKAKIQNLDNVQYAIQAKGVLDIGRIYKVFSQKGLGVKGYVKANVRLKGTQSDAVNGNYSKLQNSGTLYLRDIATTSTYLPKPFVIKEGKFSFYQDQMQFQDFKAMYGQSDFLINGQLRNVIDFVLSTTGVLKGDFVLSSRFLNADEFLSEKQGDISTATSPKVIEKGVIVLPKNMDLQFKAQLEELEFQDLKVNGLQGKLALKNGQLQLRDAVAEIIGCQVKMQADYADETLSRAAFDLKLKATDFDVQRAYKEVKLFREMVTAAESAQGIIGLDYAIQGKLNDQMMPIFPSLKGGGVLSVNKVKMKGFKLMNVVSRSTGKDKLKDPDLSKVDIKTKINNNIITIERFKFKVAGFRPRIEGTTSFDGRLNLKMRLGLPPLGIIGIPLKITGTQENPRVRLGKQTEDLEETEYEEGMEHTPNTTAPGTVPVPPTADK